MAAKPPPPPNPTPPPSGAELAAKAAELLAKKVKAQMEDIAGTINKVIHSVERVGTAISATLTGLIYFGARGTVEAQQLQYAFYQFARSIADAFAPIIRGATFLLQRMASFIRGLSSEAKAAIVVIGGLTIITTALTAALGGVAIALAAVTAAFITNPIGAAITAIVVGLLAAVLAIPAGLVIIKGLTDGWEETMYNILAIGLDLWKLVVEIGKTLKEWHIDKALIEAFKMMNPILSMLAMIKPSTQSYEEVKKMFGQKGDLTTQGVGRVESTTGTWDRIQSNIRGSLVIATEQLKALRRIEQNTEPRNPAAARAAPLSASTLAIWDNNLGLIT